MCAAPTRAASSACWCSRHAPACRRVSLSCKRPAVPPGVLLCATPAAAHGLYGYYVSNNIESQFTFDGSPFDAPFPRTPILAAFLAATSLPAAAALQPVSEAPLAGDVEFQCRFGQDNSTECLSTYRYTILTLSGRDLISRVDRSYAENDSLEVVRAEVIQPGEKPVALDAAQIDTRMAPNPEQGFLRQSRPRWPFPICGSAAPSSIRCASALPPCRTPRSSTT